LHISLAVPSFSLRGQLRLDAEMFFDRTHALNEVIDLLAVAGHITDPLFQRVKIPASSDLAPGHVVIAKQTFECGWWEAVVVERNGDLLTLTHRDYPRIPKIKRHRSAIALISAAAP